MSLLHSTEFNAAIALFVDANLLLISLSFSPSSYIFDPKYLKSETFFITFFSKTRSFFMPEVKYSVLLKWMLRPPILYMRPRVFSLGIQYLLHLGQLQLGQ